MDVHQWKSGWAIHHTLLLPLDVYSSKAVSKSLRPWAPSGLYPSNKYKIKSLAPWPLIRFSFVRLLSRRNLGSDYLITLEIEIRENLGYVIEIVILTNYAKKDTISSL